MMLLVLLAPTAVSGKFWGLATWMSDAVTPTCSDRESPERPRPAGLGPPCRSRGLAPRTESDGGPKTPTAATAGRNVRAKS
jgi:hypothetical protein